MSEPDDPTIAAWVGLVRATRSVRGEVERALKADGLPPLGWYDVLLELRRRPDGLRPFELEHELLLEQHNLSRLADRIVAAGYAERVPAPEDRRGHRLHITQAGRDLLARAWPVYRDALARAIGSRLAPEEAAALARLAGALRR